MIENQHIQKEEPITRTNSANAGTLLTAELALQHGLAVNTAGGTHHAFPAHGSGFCILNDLAVTAMELLGRGAVRRVLVLDLDVHQVGHEQPEYFQIWPRQQPCFVTAPGRRTVRSYRQYETRRQSANSYVNELEQLFGEPCSSKEMPCSASSTVLENTAEMTESSAAGLRQGDGTAACLAGEEGVLTVSFHAEKNFPTRKQRSGLDVALPDGMGDDAYLR